jgi:hypothetical protein
MRAPLAVLSVALSCLGLTPLALAQDSHYWTTQYGTRATLLGGAVIGSVLDLSGTYYNPGGMSLIQEPDILMATKVLQYPHVTLAGGERAGVPLNTFSLSPAPSLIAGTFRLRGLPKHWFGYSYLSRQDVKLGVSLSQTGRHDILPDSPGSEGYASQFRIDEKLSEHWFGLTWSLKLLEHVGVGVTQYFAFRTHRALTQELIEALGQDDHLAMALEARQYSYYHLRMLWKIGLAADFKDLTLGLTLTSPGLALAGKGSTGVNSAVAGLDMGGDGASEDFMAADYRQRLPLTYRSPFSLAAGATFKIRQVRFYWSAEWFARVRPYTVIDAPAFAAQSTGEMLSTDVTQELDPTLNWGAGFEWFYSSRFKGYASFTTDYSAKRAGTATNMSITDWNIHHIVTGGEFVLRKFSVTVGLGFSFGGREIGQRPDILARSGIEGLWDPFHDLRFRYGIYKLIGGFAF